MKKPYQLDQRGAIAGVKSAGDAAGSILNKISGAGLQSHPGKGQTTFDLGLERLRVYAADIGMVPASIELVESRARERFLEASALLDSPIERSLLGALVTGRWSGFSTIPPPIHNARKDAIEHLPKGEVVLVPQMAFIKYRFDMGIVITDGNRRRILAVECDGAAFHDMVKDQIRDAYVASWGIPTMRFTGSRIDQDAITCADEIISKVCAWRFGDDF